MQTIPADIKSQIALLEQLASALADNDTVCETSERVIGEYTAEEVMAGILNCVIPAIKKQIEREEDEEFESEFGPEAVLYGINHEHRIRMCDVI